MLIKHIALHVIGSLVVKGIFWLTFGKANDTESAEGLATIL